MPELPRYGQPKIGLDATPQVAPLAPLEQGQGDAIVAKAAGNLASSLGAAGESIGQALDKRQKRLEEEADVAAVFGAEADFERKRKTILFDKDKGYLTAKGENAVAGSGDATAALNEAYKTTSERLTNARQKDAFARRTFDTFVNTGAAIERHAANEGERVKTERFDALRAEKLDTIAKFASDPSSDPAVFSDAVNSALSAIQGEGVRRGEAAEKTEREVSKFRRDSSKLVLDGFLGSGRSEDAAAVFEYVKGDLGAEAPKYAAEISRAGLNARAQAATDAIVNAASQDPNSRWTNPSEVRKSLAEVQDPALRAAMAPLVEHALAVDDHERRQENDRQIAIARNAFRTRHLVADIPASTWAYLINPTNGDDAARAADGFAAAEAKVVAKQKRIGTGLDKKAQIEADKLALALYKEAAEVDLPSAVSADVESDERFVDASPYIKSDIRRRQAAGKKIVDGGGLAKLQDARKFLTDALAPIKGLSKRDRAEAVAKLDDWYAEQTEANKGQPPTVSEVRKNLGKFLTKYDSDGGTPNMIIGRPKRGFQLEPGSTYQPLDPEYQDSPLAREAVETKPTTQSGAAVAPSEADKALARAIKDDHPGWSKDQVRAEYNRIKAGLAGAKVPAAPTAPPEPTLEQRQQKVSSTIEGIKAEAAAEEARKRELNAPPPPTRGITRAEALAAEKAAQGEQPAVRSTAIDAINAKKEQANEDQRVAFENATGTVSVLGPSKEWQKKNAKKTKKSKP